MIEQHVKKTWDIPLIRHWLISMVNQWYLHLAGDLLLCFVLESLKKIRNMSQSHKSINTDQAYAIVRAFLMLEAKIFVAPTKCLAQIWSEKSERKLQGTPKQLNSACPHEEGAGNVRAEK